MPFDRAKYPDNWEEISKSIRQRSDNWCECDGECGTYHEFKGELYTVPCQAKNYEPHPITGSNVVLTVAHLDHDPMNSDPKNLRAYCQRCHNNYDKEFRSVNRANRRRKEQIDAGQRILFKE